VIRRQPGSPEVTIYRTEVDENDTPLNSSPHSKWCNAIRADETESTNTNTNTIVDHRIVKAILPRYEIDSTATYGAKPEHIQGHISFKDVTFSYPTRPHEIILNGLSTEIEAGKTVAFVGPRYEIYPFFFFFLDFNNVL
jgi:ABC-type multidrug transport system fused ATPase/permease subunit